MKGKEFIDLSKLRGMGQGIILSLLLAIIARELTHFSFFSMMGPMIIAILLGMLWRSLFGVEASAGVGISFTSKYLLRAGIILLGFTINLHELFAAGPLVFTLALVAVVLGFTAVGLFGKWLRVDPTLGLLVASGTAICGAAAIAAVSAPAKAKHDESAISIAVIALLGTVFAIIDTLLYSVFPISAAHYGLFTGSSLHEIAHVVAAATPAGDKGMEMALLVKMSRVLLLIPVVLLVGIWKGKKEKENVVSDKKLPIPWFIFGFLLVSLLNSGEIVSESWTQHFVSAAYLLMTMAMAAMGLSVKWEVIRQKGGRLLLAGLSGSVILAVVMFFLSDVVLR
ncbi:YeiH family protein [Rubeoparvulum massiliense]|uniref:YeiH family protein n=1 Tax=Rubeoparvulum massiliense TaxID=1631346 RepID=UPI00065DCE08|nr:putative sulfate exporter family transporter [Rubeoparvulum massiliense]